MSEKPRANIEAYEKHVEKEIEKLRDRLRNFALSTDEQIEVRRKIEEWQLNLDHWNDEE